MDIRWKFDLCCAKLDFFVSPELFAIEFEKSFKIAVFTFKLLYFFNKPSHISTEYRYYGNKMSDEFPLTMVGLVCRELFTLEF